MLTGGETMGMSNEQFDSYKKMLLRRLERAVESNKETDEIHRLIEDLKEELSKP